MDEAKEVISVGGEEKRKIWQHHIEQAKPGSIGRYCREHALSQAAYYYWRRRLQGQAQLKRLSKPSRFARVEVSEKISTGRVRLELGQGIFLIFDREPSVCWIKELLALLGNRS